MDTKFNAPTANFILFLFCLVLFVCSIPFTSISFYYENILVYKSYLHHCVCVGGGGGG